MKDTQAVDPKDLGPLISRASVCRIGMCLDDVPYVVPMNFGYRDSCVYLHSSKSGRKLDIIRANDNVCFEVDIDAELVDSGSPCACGMRYKSVIAFGKASLVENRAGKIEALDAITEHYLGGASGEYDEAVLEAVVIIKVELESATVKSNT